MTTWSPSDKVRIRCEHGGPGLRVDGWHRHAAAQRAKLDEVDVEILVGTRRDALLQAVSANSRHGLRRSSEDKRRAVRSLLQDEEWCALSTRELGRLAGVSHAFVGQVRRHYGIEAGQVLDEEILERVDGELPERWQSLAGDHYGHWAQACRRATTLADLEKASHPYFGERRDQMVELRLRELAIKPWPWPDRTDGQRKTRCPTLDTLEDLEAALLAEGCPDRLTLWHAWTAARKIPKVSAGYELDGIKEAVRGRAALVRQVRARAKALTQAVEEQPWRRAAAVVAMEPAEAIEALEGDPKLAAEIPTSRVDPAVRAKAREVLEAAHGPARACLDPRCDGWVPTWGSQHYRPCSVCRQSEEGAARRLGEPLTTAGELLAHPGQVVDVELDGLTISIDARAVAVLAELQVLAHVTLLDRLPLALRSAVEKWLEEGEIVDDGEAA